MGTPIHQGAEWSEAAIVHCHIEGGIHNGTHTGHPHNARGSRQWNSCFPQPRRQSLCGGIAAVQGVVGNGNPSWYCHSARGIGL